RRRHETGAASRHGDGQCQHGGDSLLLHSDPPLVLFCPMPCTAAVAAPVTAHDQPYVRRMDDLHLYAIVTDQCTDFRGALVVATTAKASCEVQPSTVR